MNQKMTRQQRRKMERDFMKKLKQLTKNNESVVFLVITD